MTSSTRLEAANAGCRLATAGRKEDLADHAPRDLQGASQSFQAKWQSLLGIGRSAGDHGNLPNGETNKGLSSIETAGSPKEQNKPQRERHERTLAYHNQRPSVVEKADRAASISDPAQGFTVQSGGLVSQAFVAVPSQAYFEPRHLAEFCTHPISAKPEQLEGHQSRTGGSIAANEWRSATGSTSEKSLKESGGIVQGETFTSADSHDDNLGSAKNIAADYREERPFKLALQAQDPRIAGGVTQLHQNLVNVDTVAPRVPESQEEKPEAFKPVVNPQGITSTQHLTSAPAESRSERANSSRCLAARSSNTLTSGQIQPMLHGTSPAPLASEAVGMREEQLRGQGASAPTQTSPEPGNQGPTTNVHQTFASLDAADGPPVARWLSTGSNRAEAGFEDPSLGWVGVRAQVNSAGVHAIVVPRTSDAAQSLGTHIPGLTAYLADHRVPIQTLTIANAVPEGHSGNHSMQYEQEAGQGSDRRESPNPQTDEANLPLRPSRISRAMGGNGDTVLPSKRIVVAGTTISVVA